MISCLMVTQPARLELAALAIGDFAAQTHAERELIIVHDGDSIFHAAIVARAEGAAGQPIRVVCAPAGLTLGALRNLAVAAAASDFVCQWDDDDRYHPLRLARQWQALCEARTDFCFLGDQLHWFAEWREMYWDDWDSEPYPLNLVQGTLLGRRDRMPVYPEVARGEDTGLLKQILRSDNRVLRLRDAGWCYVYVYHGANVWAIEHHAAISRAKAHGKARLFQRESILRSRLAEYVPGFGAVRLPYESGCLDIATV
jgi:glycosyltransferase involved in cell wall biosynthesis